MLNETDMRHLRRCVELAEEALAAGEKPFASVLVAADGRVLAEDRNRTVSGGDPTLHPEFALARWAATNLSAEERRAATVYTSGEHCPMCSAAHGWVGLGRIVYVSSAAQLSEWMAEFGVSGRPINPIPIRDVVPGIAVEGPVAELAGQIRELQRRFYRGA